MCYTGKIQKRDRKCFKFIWNGKPDKVNRNTLIDFEKGELKMIDIESYFIQNVSLMASWVSILTESIFSNWKLIPLTHLYVFWKYGLFLI